MYKNYKGGSTLRWTYKYSMACGCGKKKCEGTSCKSKSSLEVPKETIIMNNNDNSGPLNFSRKNPTWVSPNTQQEPTFTDRTIEPQNSVVKGFSMAKSFMSSLASKGINSEKVSVPLKQLRVLSCFGNKDTGGQLPPCEYLRKSSTVGKFFCGGCGCGDKPLTWLTGWGDEYGKLDYPKLACPLQMPGFSNYKEAIESESISPITRRAYIETLNYDQIKTINVSMPQKPETPEKTE